MLEENQVKMQKVSSTYQIQMRFGEEKEVKAYCFKSSINIFSNSREKYDSEKGFKKNFCGFGLDIVLVVLVLVSK